MPAFKDNLYEIQVRDLQSMDGISNDGVITDGCLVFVYTAGTKTLATLYSTTNRATLANPITRTQFATDDMIRFYSEATSHDIFVAHSDGSVGRFAGVTPNTHSVVLNRTSADKMLVVPFVFNDNVETDTGIDFPTDVAIFPPIIQVVTNDATETIDVGLLSSETAGDANGLIQAASLATAGYVRPYVITDGTNEDFVATPVVGALIGLGSAGTDTANDFGSQGGYCHVVTGSNAKSLTYTCSSGSDTAAGYIYVPFKHLR